MRRVYVEALSMQLIGPASRGRIELPALRRRGRSRPHEHLRTTLFLWAIPALVWLTWLVARGEPLPLDDVGSACVATVIYCVITIGAVYAGARLPPLSFPSLFLWATFLFTCSPLLLYQIRGPIAFASWEWVDMSSVLVAMPVVMLAFTAFLVAALLVPGPSAIGRPEPVRVGSVMGVEARLLRVVGFVLYAVSFIMVLAATLRGSALTYAFEGGYHAFHGAKRAGEVSQFAGTSMSRLLPWSLLILAATSRGRRERVLVVLMAIPVLGMMLAIGDRSGPLATLVLLASGLYLLGSRHSGWSRAVVVGVLVAFLTPAILNLRTVPISAWSPDVLAQAAANEVEGTPAAGEGLLGGFLVSMSSSYQTLMATVNVVPAREDYHLGSDYLSSLVVGVPFRSTLFSLLDVEIREVSPSQWVLTYLHPGRTAGPGYLQVAEAYLQFGVVGVVGLYLFLGWALTRLWRFVSDKARDPQLLAFGLILMSETLIWVRNSSSLFVRAVVWGWFLVYAMPAILRIRRRRVARTQVREPELVHGGAPT